MDDIARFNRERWGDLVRAKVAYSRPFLDLTPDRAQRIVDPFGLLGDLAGRCVLCLAGGGGQQSACFGVLGAQVTVIDITPEQLEQDRLAAAHYGHEVRTVEGDMRDLSAFAEDEFDVVWHAHSLNFVPDAESVFAEVVRVLRPGGWYRLSCWNPHAHGIDERHWTGEGYVVSRPYGDGPMDWLGEDWPMEDEDGNAISVPGPKEFRHTLSTLLNGQATRGLRLHRMAEYGGDGFTFEEHEESTQGAEPGTWEHFCGWFRPWIETWSRLEEEIGRART
jgi:SAM-dependent methyltransferase